MYLLCLLFYEVFPGLFFDAGIEHFLIPFAYWIYVQRIVVQIMYEKSSKLQESMRMMGLYDISYWVSYFIMDGIILGFALSFITTIITTSGMFGGANFGTILGFTYLYTLSVTCFSFFLTAFFDTPQSSGQAVIAILMGLFVCYIVVFPSGQNQISPLAAETISSFFPPLAFQIACSTFLKSHEGASLSTINGIMVADIFIYCFLTWYFYQILPSEYGVQKPFYFLIQPSYWFPKNSSSESIEDVEEGVKYPLEQVNEKVFGAPSVVVEKLRKTYGPKRVINNLSFKMYENQIFSLLGHNGAGKSTTVSILTGLIGADMFSGSEAHIYGHSITTEMQHVRGSMGVCPQHDVLFENLSVKEHIIFFAMLKGYDYQDAEREAIELTNMFHLDNRLDHLGNELSGGQRRKLSVGIAVCGGSKFVVLDEPTAGMDPLARRELWDLLASLRKGRSMLLITHYMDEADVLGDRIGIMSLGQMQCCGSSQFLKGHYGAGYQLIFDKKEDSTPKLEEEVVEHVQKFVPQASRIFPDGASGQIVLTLPFNSIKSFGKLFSDLENNLESRFHVKNFNILITSLEDVFLKVGEDHSVVPTSTASIGIGSATAYQTSFLSQVIGLCGRKLKYAMNDISTLALLILPIGAIIAAGVLHNLDIITKDQSTNDLIAAGIFLGGYLGASGFIAEFVVKERSDKLRNVLTVMGCDFKAYWAGTFLADYIILLIPMLVMYIVWGFCDMGGYYHGSLSPGLNYFNWILFNAHLIAFSYFFSLTFSTPKACISFMPILILLLVITPSILIMIAIIIVQAAGEDFTDSFIAGVLLWGMIIMTPHGNVFTMTINATGDLRKDISKLPPYGACVAIAIFEIVAYMLIVYRADILSVAQVPCIPHDPTQDISELESTLDEDVLKERTETITSSNDAYPLVIKELRKVFPPKVKGRPAVVATENISFKVSKGEVFGLLGANGAGKTTTLTMLTRLLLPNSGDAFLSGESILTEFTKAATHLGVVTQNNSLWDRLSVEDHLYLFARIRGVPESEVNRIVDGTIDQLELRPHRKKLSMSLSGGMKRKLCVAIALVGDPEVVLLDEPSAGLDPVSRRNLWSVILRTMSERSVILTTHSMEEAEALCARIGIMVRGQMRALGTRQHLKYKFGSGYELTVKLLVATADDVDTLVTKFTQFLVSLFPNSKIIAENGGLVTYQIPKEEMKVGLIFQELENNKEEFLIEDYSVAQPTLEQVFIRIVNKHTPPTGKLLEADGQAAEVEVHKNKCGCTNKVMYILMVAFLALAIAFFVISGAVFGEDNKAGSAAFGILGVIGLIGLVVSCLIRFCPCCNNPKDEDE